MNSGCGGSFHGFTDAQSLGLALAVFIGFSLMRAAWISCFRATAAVRRRPKKPRRGDLFIEDLKHSDIPRCL
jgi:hypothetical protein